MMKNKGINWEDIPYGSVIEIYQPDSDETEAGTLFFKHNADESALTISGLSWRGDADRFLWRIVPDEELELFLSPPQLSSLWLRKKHNRLFSWQEVPLGSIVQLFDADKKLQQVRDHLWFKSRACDRSLSLDGVTYLNHKGLLSKDRFILRDKGIMANQQWIIIPISDIALHVGPQPLLPRLYKI